MVLAPIDVWQVASFDNELLAALRPNAGLICDYLATDQQNFLEREASWPRMAYPLNPHAAAHQQLVEDCGRLMEARTIRGWHYTRLTDAEVDRLRATGIALSSLAATRWRLDALVAAGELSAETAEDLFATSPFHHPEQVEGRADKFWMTSHPQEIGDSGVNLLLGYWGGEAVYFWLQDPQLKARVAGIGKARILEVAVPLAATRHAYSAGQAVVATYARSIGCIPDFRDFDLYVTHPLGPEAILVVHSEGESAFSKVGRGYPVDFTSAER